MPSDEDHRTTRPPTKFEIGGTFVLFMIVLSGAAFSVSRPTFNGPWLVVFLVNVVGTLILGGKFVNLVSERCVWRIVSDFEHTGTWYHPETGDVALTVRFDPDNRLFHVTGQPVPGWVVDADRGWMAANMADILSWAEQDGLRPGGDPQTYAVRKRLGLTR